MVMIYNGTRLSEKCSLTRPAIRVILDREDKVLGIEVGTSNVHTSRSLWIFLNEPQPLVGRISERIPMNEY